jgi:hypothetical protein
MAFGFIKRLFSSPDMVISTAKSAIKGLDDIVYTDQERAEKTEVAQNLYARLWEAAVPSAISRRVIASFIVLVWAIITITTLAFIGVGWDEKASKSIELLETVVVQPMNIVVGFYFLKQVVTEYRKK